MSELSNNPIFKKIKTQINENEILKKLQEEYTEYINLLEFNEYNVGDRARNNAFIIENFRMLSINEKHKLKKLERKINEKMGKLYNHFKYEDDRDLTKVEIERYYLTTDDELNKLKKLYDLQEIRVGFFDAMADAFKSQGFNIKNFIDNLRTGS